MTGPQFSDAGPTTNWIERTGRRRLTITGPDRAKFLHNLTTNEIKRLPEGSGCEAFVTSPQGKTLGYIFVHNLGESLLVRAEVAGQEALDRHLAKYGMFDDVAIRDDSATTCEFHVHGELSGPPVESLGLRVPEGSDYRHEAQTLGSHVLRVISENPTGLSGITIIAPAEGREAIRARLDESFGAEMSGDLFDFARISAGTPLFGRDVMPENLPQEVGRDPRAISFVKGCYLGQETVARIDALGHVNKLLKGFRLAGGPVPAPGTVLEADGKAVGTITSTAVDPRTGRAVAMGYVRVQHATDGTALAMAGSGEDRRVTVSDFPIAPEG